MLSWDLDSGNSFKYQSFDIWCPWAPGSLQRIRSIFQILISNMANFTVPKSERSVFMFFFTWHGYVILGKQKNRSRSLRNFWWLHSPSFCLGPQVWEYSKFSPHKLLFLPKLAWGKKAGEEHLDAIPRPLGKHTSYRLLYRALCGWIFNTIY